MTSLHTGGPAGGLDARIGVREQLVGEVGVDGQRARESDEVHIAGADRVSHRRPGAKPSREGERDPQVSAERASEVEEVGLALVSAASRPNHRGRFVGAAGDLYEIDARVAQGERRVDGLLL